MRGRRESVEGDVKMEDKEVEIGTEDNQDMGKQK